MQDTTGYTLPVYTQEHFSHYRQLCEWDFEIDRYKDELFAYRLNQPKHFYEWIKGKPKVERGRKKSQKKQSKIGKS